MYHLYQCSNEGLCDSADGNYEVTILTKATLHSDGLVIWKPPAIYKSSCEIDVEYFPFDEQTCFMKFGSWTYDGYTVDLKHKDQRDDSPEIKFGIDLSEFYLSVEWDIMAVPALRKEKFYSCCEEPYPDITFNITLRRKTLFYTVNLIIPCVAITFLSILVFYLPSDSGEKVSLSISIILSLGVFFLLLSEIIPPTSLAVPLLGKYLLFTMILVCFSVFVTIAVLNVNFRSPSTHRMAPWVKKVFLEILPRLVCLTRPDEDKDEGSNPEVKTAGPELPYGVMKESPAPEDLHPDLQRAVTNIRFISHHTENKDSFSGCADAFRMLTVAYGEATLDRSNVYRWYKMFSEGREDVNDKERAGRPSTSTTDEKINEVEKMISANRRITVREVAEDLNISIGSCHSIFINDLGMRRVAAKFVPKLLNCDQKQHRMNIANEMLDSVRDDPNLLQRVITGDEAWVYGYDLPHEPRPKKARQVRSNVKVLLTVFFDCRGVVHHVFLPQGRMVNKEYYLQVQDDWQFVAMVLDRIFLFLFSTVCFLGSGLILLRAPALYDDKQPIDIIFTKMASHLQGLNPNWFGGALHILSAIHDSLARTRRSRILPKPGSIVIGRCDARKFSPLRLGTRTTSSRFHVRAQRDDEFPRSKHSEMMRFLATSTARKRYFQV
ncbi:nAChRa1 [Cordylochernes scorpioides]|uniref:NAChRa1 n=1 Tax=Cordylochernes scorpioides TaxID=51811 RepID=A0ABY6K8L5_9ARAC|nr:nAChRa1 [Cordylochernes scorpioides]